MTMTRRGGAPVSGAGGAGWLQKAALDLDPNAPSFPSSASHWVVQLWPTSSSRNWSYNTKYKSSLHTTTPPSSPLLPRSQCRGWYSYLKCNVHQHYCTIPPPLSPSFISYYLVVQLLPVSHTFVFVYRFRCTEAQKYTSCDKWCSKKSENNMVQNNTHMYSGKRPLFLFFCLLLGGITLCYCNSLNKQLLCLIVCDNIGGETLIPVLCLMSLWVWHNT